MKAKEECKQACVYLLNNGYEVKELGNDNYEFIPSDFKESEIFRNLIIDYFKLKKDKEVLEKELDIEIKEIGFNLSGSDGCDSLEEACEGAKKLIEDRAKEETENENNKIYKGSKSST